MNEYHKKVLDINVETWEAVKDLECFVPIL